jgi:hypothetical protein
VNPSLHPERFEEGNQSLLVLFRLLLQAELMAFHGTPPAPRLHLLAQARQRVVPKMILENFIAASEKNAPAGQLEPNVTPPPLGKHS